MNNFKILKMIYKREGGIFATGMSAFLSFLLISVWVLVDDCPLLTFSMYCTFYLMHSLWLMPLFLMFFSIFPLRNFYEQRKNNSYPVVNYETVKPLILLNCDAYDYNGPCSSISYAFTYEYRPFFLKNFWEYYKTLVLLQEEQEHLKDLYHNKKRKENTEQLFKSWQKDIDRAVAESQTALEVAKKEFENIQKNW